MMFIKTFLKCVAKSDFKTLHIDIFLIGTWLINLQLLSGLDLDSAQPGLAGIDNLLQRITVTNDFKIYFIGFDLLTDCH